MKDIQLIRLDQDENRTLGKLVIDQKLFCFTFEPPWKNNKKNISCIPIGRYYFKTYYSEKYQCLCIGLHDVPGRDYICIHPGNFAKDTKGCILPGDSLTVNYISNSGNALDMIVKKFPIGGFLKIKTIC